MQSHRFEGETEGPVVGGGRDRDGVADYVVEVDVLERLDAAVGFVRESRAPGDENGSHERVLVIIPVDTARMVHLAFFLHLLYIA